MAIEFQQGNGRQERRHAERAPVWFDASIRERGRSAQNARIETLSRLGCSVTGYGFIHQGAHVWVKLPGLQSLTGWIAWCHEQRAGIFFEQPLHPAVLARFVNLPNEDAPATEPGEGPSFFAANDTLLTRREQIMQGIAETERSPLLRRKAKSGAGIMGFINRQVVRQTNYRFEQRFADPVATGSTQLQVEGRDARVINVSASGLRLAVDLEAEIGNEVSVEFEGFDSYPGRLVWLRDGEAGISLPPNTIELCLDA